MPRSAARQLRAEVRKAASPLLVLALIVFGLSVWRDLSTTTRHFASQSQGASGTALWLADRTEQRCADVPPDEPHCMLAQRDLVENQPLVANGCHMGRVAASMGHPAAVAQFVARQAISGAGWLLLAFVAMALVVGERSAGTADDAIRRLGRPRFLLVKWSAVVTVTLVLLSIVVVALMALRHSYVETVTAFTGVDAGGAPVGSVDVPPDPSWTSWSTALATILVAVALLSVVAASAVPLAARSRTMAWFGIGSLAVVAVVFAASRATQGAWWAPMTAIDRAAELWDVPPGMRDVRIWDLSSRAPDVDQFGVPRSGSMAAMAGLAALCLACAGALAWDFVRRGPRT